MRSILNVVAAVICLCAVARADEPIKLGIIGLDTSHAVRFDELLNDPSNPNHVPGAVIVAAYKATVLVPALVGRVDSVEPSVVRSV